MLVIPRIFGNLTGPIPTSYLDQNFTAIGQTFIATIAELRTVPKTGSGVAFVQGYYAMGDGGGGWYYHNVADTTSADNGGTIIVASDGGRWYLSLVLNEKFSPLTFGANGTGGDDTTALQNAMNFIPSGGTLDMGDATKTYGVTAAITRPSGGFRLIGQATTKYIGAGSPVGVLVTTDISNIYIEDYLTFDANSKALNAIAVLATAVNISTISIKKVIVKNTATDGTLTYGGVAIYPTGGLGTVRPSNVTIENITSMSCGTHGAITAYSDNVKFNKNTVTNSHNHGFEAVGCTDVQEIGNYISAATLSGLGVGANTIGFEIAGNHIDNCHGDGSITMEHNSVRGSCHHNVVTNCNTTGINLSYGTDHLVYPTDCVRDVFIHHNELYAKTGVTTYKAVNAYSSTSPNVGINIKIDDNKAYGFNGFATVSFFSASSFSRNYLENATGSPIAFIIATLIDHCDIDGNLATNVNFTDTPFQLLSYAGNDCTKCSISHNKILTSNTGPNKPLVFINGAGIGFQVNFNDTQGSSYFLQFSGAAGQANVIGNGGTTTGGVYTGGGAVNAAYNNI